MIQKIINLFKPSVVKEPTATEKFFKSLNYSIRNRIPILEYYITDFPIEEFKDLYHGLKALGIEPDMTSRKENGFYHEFFVIKISDYRGPRDQDLKPLKIHRADPLDKSTVTQIKPEKTQSKKNEPPKFYPPKESIAIENNLIKVDFKSRKKVS